MADGSVPDTVAALSRPALATGNPHRSPAVLHGRPCPRAAPRSVISARAEFSEPLPGPFVPLCTCFRAMQSADRARQLRPGRGVTAVVDGLAAGGHVPACPRARSPDPSGRAQTALRVPTAGPDTEGVHRAGQPVNSAISNIARTLLN